LKVSQVGTIVALVQENNWYFEKTSRNGLSNFRRNGMIMVVAAVLVLVRITAVRSEEMALEDNRSSR